MRSLIVMVLAALALTFAGCTAEVEDEGQLPAYDVEQTQEGRMPDVDVEPADVEVETAPLEVPTDIDVEPAGE